MYDRTAIYLRGYYDSDSDDDSVTDKEKHRNQQRPAKTPRGQGTLRSYRARERRKRAEEILHQNRKTKTYPELTTEQFATMQREKRRLRQMLKRLNRKQRSAKKTKSPYEIPREKTLQLRL